MNRTQKIWLGVLAAFALLVVVLLVRNPQPPFIPADEDHRDLGNIEACITCHGRDGGAPRGPNHPLGNDCTRCHGTR